MLIHVGYPKTGSTTLQDHVFCNSELGFVMPWEWPREAAINHFVQVNPFEHNPATERRILELASRNCDRSLVRVLTHECLTGAPGQGLYYDPIVIAQRLNKAFPEAKVLICIREQRTMISALYRQAVRQGHFVGSIDGFVRVDRPTCYPYKPCRLDHLKYHYVVELYQSLFGRDNVLTLPFEVLQRDTTAFVASICNFVGLAPPQHIELPRSNEGIRGAGLAVLKRIYRHSPPSLVRRSAAEKIASFVSRSVPASVNKRCEIRATRYIASITEGYFEQDNALLQEMTGLNLKQFGYSVADRTANAQSTAAVISSPVASF